MIQVGTLEDFIHFSLGSKLLRIITNHPVHVQDEDGNLSPTALIPFCELGGNMSVMGVEIDEFDIPFCNAFREDFKKRKREILLLKVGRAKTIG